MSDFSLKGVMRMNELNDLIASLAELIRRISELLDKIEYIAIKRIKK